MSETYAAVRACSIVLLAGAILQVEGVSAGNGKVIDWRTVKWGETLMSGGDAFDTAYLFVALVGVESAFRAVARDFAVEPAPELAEPPARVHAYAVQPCGGRRRSFDAGPFTVYVEPHEDDAAQEVFTERLAALAAARRAT